MAKPTIKQLLEKDVQLEGQRSINLSSDPAVDSNFRQEANEFLRELEEKALTVKGPPRVMAVLNPLPVVIYNYPDHEEEHLDAINNPEEAGMGTRTIPFSKVLYIERDDFREDPPKQFFRLAPGREVRLRYAYYITCERVVKDDRTGEIVELHCRYDPNTRGGDSPDRRNVKSTLHWVSEPHALQAEVRLYDKLFS